MLIETAFKEFTAEALSKVKGKKEHDLCIDIYAKTQLVDISAIFLNTELTLNCERLTGGGYLGQGGVLSVGLSEDLDILLPFECSFIKLYDEGNMGFDESAFLFIREYAPLIYTGKLIAYMSNGVLHTLFDIRIDPLNGKKILNIQVGTITSAFDSSATATMLSKFVLNRIISSLGILARLSNKTHDIHRVDSVRPEYLRKKLTKSAIKVERPVYIYMDKKVYVSNCMKSYSGRKVERLNSWIVRGHWRRLDNPKKRGKNALGQYVVEGFTWVVPHVCGDPDGLTNKTHIVINN
jgi:hypothetical protein